MDAFGREMFGERQSVKAASRCSKHDLLSDELPKRQVQVQQERLMPTTARIMFHAPHEGQNYHHLPAWGVRELQALSEQMSVDGPFLARESKDPPMPNRSPGFAPSPDSPCVPQL